MYHSEWAFVTYVNLTNLTLEAEHLEKTVEKIQLLCNNIQSQLDLPIPSAYCDHAMPELHFLLDDIKDYSVNWFTHHESPRHVASFQHLRRKKRNILSKISKRLFCSMSDEEATMYSGQINELKATNEEYFLLAKNQTTLFQETLKVLNNTLQSQSIQHSALQKQFNELEMLLNNASASEMLTGKLNELMHYTTIIANKFWDKQRNFYEMITTKSKSFHLIPPQTFMTELERVSRLIAPQGLRLPLPLTVDHLSKFYQITTAEGRLVDNNLVVRFSIPLVQTKRFTLFKVIKAPYRNATDSTFRYIVPRNEYIAIDRSNETFITLTRDELKSCHQISRNSLVCKQTFPFLNANNSQGCEINLLRNVNERANCDVRVKNLTEEIWVTLQSPNTYLYTLPKAELVSIDCPHSQTKLTLEGTGVISLTPKCRIKTDRVEFVAYQTIKSEFARKHTAQPKYNVSVSTEIDNAKHVKSLSNPKLPNYFNENDPKKITDIHSMLDSLQPQIRIFTASVLDPIKESSINSVVLVIIGIAVIVITILIAIICFKYCAISACNLVIFMGLIVFVSTGMIYFIWICDLSEEHCLLRRIQMLRGHSKNIFGDFFSKKKTHEKNACEKAKKIQLIPSKYSHISRVIENYFRQSFVPQQ